MVELKLLGIDQSPQKVFISHLLILGMLVDVADSRVHLFLGWFMSIGPQYYFLNFLGVSAWILGQFVGSTIAARQLALNFI